MDNIKNIENNIKAPGRGWRTAGVQKTGSTAADTAVWEAGGSPVENKDKTEFSSKADPLYQKNLKKNIDEHVEGFNKGLVGVNNFQSYMRSNFSKLGPDERQEYVVHLFSEDPEIKSSIAENFARLNPESPDFTPLDMAAREKSLVNARNHLKKGPVSKTSARSWIYTLGKLGEKKDTNILAHFQEDLKESGFSNSPMLRNASLKALDEIISRNNNGISPEASHGLTDFVTSCLNSDSRKTRIKTADVLMKLSGCREFTSKFSRSVQDIPTTEKTAESLGHFAQNLRESGLERITFTSLVLDKTMKKSDDDFKRRLLSTATGHFLRYPVSENPDTARDTTSVLGKYFEDFINGEDKKISFRKMSSKEKINNMIDFFHQH